jgi:hypothetical protein
MTNMTKWGLKKEIDIIRLNIEYVCKKQEGEWDF